MADNGTVGRVQTMMCPKPAPEVPPGTPEMRAWDGVQSGSPAEEYLKSARGGLDPVRADSFHYQQALSLQDGIIGEVIGAGLGYVLKLGAKLLGAAKGVAKPVVASPPPPVVPRAGGGNGVVVQKNLPPLRQEYIDSVEKLKAKRAAMAAEGKSDEAIARELHAERRALGEQYKSLTPAEKLDEIYARNVQKYGDKLGPSVDWLRDRGKTWGQISESATRTGGKDLGF